MNDLHARSDIQQKLGALGLDPVLTTRIGRWLTAPYDDETIRAVRQAIQSGDTVDLTDAFYKDLEFGTGGLRGVIGAGTNRMNRYTVGRATQGFANYLRKQYPAEQIRVAVSYDSRHLSVDFSRLIAEIFAANGFEVFRFAEMRPTPHLSFAIRELRCHGGVMITASHNPREYNGYKAYWRDGGQLVAPHDRGVIREVEAVTDPSQVRGGDLDDATQVKGEVHLLGTEMDEAYIRALTQQTLRPEVVALQSDLGIVYSSLHGTGITLVPRVLQQWGFTHVQVVEEQARPDGDFPTVIYPNPEESEAMTQAIAQATRCGAELAMATDPDADRVGLAIRLSEPGEPFQLLNGNQIGSLLVDYVLSSMHEKGTLKPGDYVAKTIVTTGLIRDIALAYGIPCDDVLTGFKYIGELMTHRELEARRFLVGGEESFGYLIGDLVRDKDAVISCAFIAEMAAFHKSRGKSLHDALLDLYLRHGYYKEKLISLTKKGQAGAEEIRQMMDRLRNGSMSELGGVPIIRINDYLRQQALDVLTGAYTPLDLPVSDVLQFVTADGDILSVRPSGTEPKIKFYCSAREPLRQLEDYRRVGQALDAKIDRIMESVL